MFTKTKVWSILFTLIFLISFTVMMAQPTGAFELYLVNVKTGEVEKLTDIPDVGIFNASFSNNGKYVVAEGVSDYGQALLAA